jgi:hypothetical protein
MLRAICLGGATEQKGCTLPADLHDGAQLVGFLSYDCARISTLKSDPRPSATCCESALCRPVSAPAYRLGRKKLERSLRC